MKEIHSIAARFGSGMGRIAHFWGFPKAVGVAYSAVYLSTDPVTLDDLVGITGISKGGLSTHMRTLERLGIVHRESRPGDRKDYYSADTDFWSSLLRLLRERERHEFDRAIGTVKECLTLLETVRVQKQNAATAAFYRERMLAMQRFFDRLDRVVAAILTMDEIGGAALGKVFGKTRPQAKR